jgi:hypothetical protein
VSESSVTFLTLYVDDILLIGNDISILDSMKFSLSSVFLNERLGRAYIYYRYSDFSGKVQETNRFESKYIHRECVGEVQYA